VSVAAPPPPTASRAGRSAEAAAESCPVCGSALHREQDWCLHCGAAARTRLAGSPSWGAPAAALAAVVVLAVGVLAAALVKLAGDSGSSPQTITRTVTTQAPAGLTSPGASAGATTPTTGTSTSRAGAAASGTGAKTGGAATGTATTPRRTRTPLSATGGAAGRKAFVPAGVRHGKRHRVIGHTLEKQLQKLREQRRPLK
jgi:hypothetical protein